MNLEDQKKSGVGEIYVSDSLNAPLLQLKVMNISTSDNIQDNFIVYVDKNSKNNPTEERREYVFELQSIIQYNEYFETGVEVYENKVNLVTKIVRGDNFETLENYPITLFEGENYIYTNYDNVSLEIVYSKNNELNRFFLSTMMQYIFSNNHNGIISLDDIYFKDAFTKTEAGLNFDINNIKLDSLISKNNKFSLDEDGNLIVKTITATNQDISNGINSVPTMMEIIDTIYPVGSIYMSMSTANPNVIFGGTWSLFGNGRCLVGVDTEQEEFNLVEKEGGAKTHALTTDELPTHSHTISSSGAHKHTYTGFIQVSASSSSTYTAIAHKRYTADGAATPPSMNSTGSHTHTVNETGSSFEHNNLQPYITCYMWKRIA